MSLHFLLLSLFNNFVFGTMLVKWEQPFVTSLKILIFEWFLLGDKKNFKTMKHEIGDGSDPSAHYEYHWHFVKWPALMLQSKFSRVRFFYDTFLENEGNFLKVLNIFEKSTYSLCVFFVFLRNLWWKYGTSVFLRYP